MLRHGFLGSGAGLFCMLGQAGILGRCAGTDVWRKNARTGVSGQVCWDSCSPELAKSSPPLPPGSPLCSWLCQGPAYTGEAYVDQARFFRCAGIDEVELDPEPRLGQKRSSLGLHL